MYKKYADETIANKDGSTKTIVVQAIFPLMKQTPTTKSTLRG